MDDPQIRPSANASRLAYPARALAFLTAIVVIATLYWGREILMPLALATLCAFLLAPAVRCVERARVGRFFAVLLVSLAALGTLGSLGWLVVQQAANVMAKLPEHREKIISRIRAVRATLPAGVDDASHAVGEISREIVGPTPATASAPASAPAGLAPQISSAAVASPLGSESGAPSTAPAEQPVRVEMVPPPADLAAAFGTTIAPLVNPIFSLGMTALFAMFFLMYREDLRDRIVCLCGRAHVHVTTTALTDVGTRMTRFMLAQAVSNALCGATIGAGLFLMGVPQAFLWGLLTGVLRFVPFLGLAVSAALPTVLSLAISVNPLLPFGVIGWFLLVDVAISNVFDPWYYGSRVGASPTAILLGIVFWGWLWGPMGILLATPLLVCLVVLGKHVPAFENLYILFGDEPVFEPSMRLYQRLLASDQREVLAIVAEESVNSSPEAVLTGIVLPALARFETDRQTRVVDSQRVDAAKAAVTALLQTSSSNPSELASEAAPVETSNILCALGPGAFDDCLREMVEHGLHGLGVTVHGLSGNALASEIADAVRRLRPRAVLIAAVGPRDLSRVELICRRIRATAPTTHIVVGLIQSSSVRSLRPVDLDRLRGARIATDLSQILSELRRVLQTPAPAPESLDPEMTFASSRS